MWTLDQILIMTWAG